MLQCDSCEFVQKHFAIQVSLAIVDNSCAMSTPIKKLLSDTRKQISSGLSLKGHKLTEAKLEQLRERETVLVLQQEEAREERNRLTEEAAKISEEQKGHVSTEATRVIEAQSSHTTEEADRVIQAFKDVVGSIGLAHRKPAAARPKATQQLSKEDRESAALLRKRKLEEDKAQKQAQKQLKKEQMDLKKAKYAEAKKAAAEAAAELKRFREAEASEKKQAKTKKGDEKIVATANEKIVEPREDEKNEVPAEEIEEPCEGEKIEEPAEDPKEKIEELFEAPREEEPVTAEEKLDGATEASAAADVAKDATSWKSILRFP